ncbi:MAG: DUF2520 domain-containing protein [Bacteroidia bacterium]
MKSPRYKIVLLGAGNVATHLGLALKKSGQPIVQVYSRQFENAVGLAKKLNCGYTDSLKTIDKTADVYIIAVKDDVVGEIAKLLKLKNKIVVHTSGSVDMNVLKTASANYGVFYPLQTFSKSNKVNIKAVPFCLEASNSKTLKSLTVLAENISNNVLEINSEQRKTIHLAAVFACNFSNHMYAIADVLLKANNLSLDILKPLIEETAKKIQHASPVEMQTGPAKRKDKNTMNKHLQLLGNRKEYKKMYRLLSKSIMDLDKQKKN